MTNETDTKKAKSGWLNLLVDYGPLLVFFLAYRHYSPEGTSDAVGEVFAVVRGTVAFMIAALIALAVSKWRLGKVSPMLWLSTALIVGFGSLTIWPPTLTRPSRIQFCSRFLECFGHRRTSA